MCNQATSGLLRALAERSTLKMSLDIAWTGIHEGFIVGQTAVQRSANGHLYPVLDPTIEGVRSLPRRGSGYIARSR